VAQRIATSLEAKLTGREQREIARVPTTNPEAYDAYLRALAFAAGRTTDEIDRAIQLHRKAVELDPQFAIAWAKLASKEAEKYSAYEHTPEQLLHAQQAAETALRLQPDLAEAHQAVGLFQYYCLQDFDRAIAELNEARARSPNNAEVLLSIAVVNRRQGKLEESIELQREAANLDPRNLDIWLNLGRSYRGARRFADAHEMFDRALTIAPGDPVATLHKAEAYIAQGDLEAAEKLTANLDQQPLDDPYGRSVSALTFRRQWEKAIAIVAADVKQKEAAGSPLAALGRALIAQFKHAAGSPDAPALLAASEKELLSLSAQGSANIRMRTVLLEVEAALGKRGEIERQAEALLRYMAKDRWIISLCEEAVARAYAILGDADRAIPLVERALSATGYAALTPAYLRFDPVWDRIRDDSRFKALSSSGVTPNLAR
jgi:tetratricopeptide (TPR) repeat protein